MGSDEREPDNRAVADARINRLEELTSFAEHRHDELHRALLDLATRLTSLSARVARTEASVAALMATPDEPALESPRSDPPPAGGRDERTTR